MSVLKFKFYTDSRNVTGHAHRPQRAAEFDRVSAPRLKFRKLIAFKYADVSARAGLISICNRKKRHTCVYVKQTGDTARPIHLAYVML